MREPADRARSGHGSPGTTGGMIATPTLSLRTGRTRPHGVMLLDKHFGPNCSFLRRVDLLAGHRVVPTILAWGCRSTGDNHAPLLL